MQVALSHGDMHRGLRNYEKYKTMAACLFISTSVIRTVIVFIAGDSMGNMQSDFLKVIFNLFNATFWGLAATTVGMRHHFRSVY